MISQDLNPGNFYGTTAVGGAHFKGIVFNIDAAGNVTTLHSFNGSPDEGANGTHFRGTVFAIDATGSVTTLHSFNGSPDEGALPFAGLIEGSDGNFYGTAALGGANGAGTVFTF